MFKNKKLIIAVCIVLIAVTALFVYGKWHSGDAGVSDTSDKNFTFTVTDLDGTQSSFDVTTSKQTVGEALTDEGLIAGDEGAYGLYVKTVNGITYDYDSDGIYWAFYIDGEMAMSGVDMTDVTEGSLYEFRAEK